ncbi:DNA-directed RNA polymerase subunit beta' [Butyrivibrio sp. DSM 10294]|uniref:DNA-directed RNA polymerase subunit beta' n=1 Tax=Butyrivibrio sp. DSM 10294 TaxID=2972457 RepID=UPI00234ED9CB|nr:DNA-directed RNA polymerase subunit beta' [Butyrivibrio sp. DSM 10294]
MNKAINEASSGRSTQQQTYQPMTFDSIKIGLASPEKIRSWAHRIDNDPHSGEVTKPETINYRTLKPERDGLFCEKIFGPTKDWECHCGKYKKIRYKGVVCDRCGVEITKSSVRRERMGYIELAAPVSHIWYFKGIPSRMGLILDLSPRVLEKVLYFASYIVLDPGETNLEYKQVLSEKEYQDAREEWGGRFRAGMGAESIKELLHDIDLEAEYKELKEGLDTSSGQKRARIIKRLEVVEAFRESGNLPEWMIMDCIPVIPPDLRPMVQLDGGRFATSDLNDLYRRIINRNNRLKRLIDLGAPDIIVRNEKRMLQEAVDALIDNGRRGRPVTGPGNRALKSLSDMLKGKSGRFRQNLLGKRVDYSGRSVIVVGPELKIYQCGLPKEMAIELFKPFVMKELVSRGISQNIKNAKKLVERLDEQVWDVLEDVIKEHPVMLNRAPTLHRLGIQAFEPILVEGKAIKLHPLVCTPFNADFDGDQMAVHLPLSVEAQAECRFLMLAPNNLLKPSDGGPVNVPTQDMVLGIYYLTQERPGALGEGKFFKSVDEAILAYENGYLTLQTRIKIRMDRTTPDGEIVNGIVESTLGRFLFNEIIPQDLGFVDRSNPENYFKLEVDFMVGKKQLKNIVTAMINTHGTFATAEVLDMIKSTGYHYSTRAAMTVSIADMTVPKQKQEMLDEAQATVDRIAANYRRGLITDEERYRAVVDTWMETDKQLTEELLKGLDKYNNIYMMADSGARGSNQQIKQLAGMRGLMADTTGRTIELPIKSNFREGLDVLEYFMSAHGARKGLSDTALRTADSGYLTRRMVDVSQELIIRDIDCCADKEVIPGMTVKAFMDGKETIEPLKDRITGRYSCETIKDKDGNVIVKKNHMITPSRAAKILSVGVNAKGQPVEAVKIRTILTCRSHNGICAKCYGANMATGEAVQVGEAVGIIAAQSIGEPGTQLTMRTFHTGGVAGGDITQGLPRVEELFEARKPKGLAIISELDGKVEIRDTKKKREVIVTNDETGESKAYLIPYGSRIKVQDGVTIEAGDELTEGSVNPHDLLKIKGIRAVQDYLLREVQRVYRLQGVDICDKHIEVIVRQMLKKVRIDESGDTDFLPGTLVDVLDFEDSNEELISDGKKPAEGKQVILGITKAALATNSFLSAASFQETTKVLTDAAIKGKVDPLIGLKENVIIGKLIPAGTGMKRYRNTALNTDANFKDPDKLILKKRRNFDDDFISEDEDIDLVDDEVVVTDDEE